MRRVETGEHYAGEVPLELFRQGAFEEKRYLDKAVEIVQRGIEALKVTRAEPIRVCSGYILSKVREELEAGGFKITRVRITGPTQELAEREYIRSLVRLGVGGEREVAGMRGFDSFLLWVQEDLERRERFVKTGWPSWPRLKREGGPR
ncbi:MAG: hypothetical protein OEW93_05905 [Candidatus Bathyarchaeota archaeon]|nr:hypothetical protein [Candidatus Bathyarchaeota archaeon]